MDNKESKKQIQDKFFQVKETLDILKAKEVELKDELQRLKGQHELLIELEKENGIQPKIINN